MARGVSFSFKTEDSTGKVPDQNMIGKRFRDSGNKKVYTVTGFVWDGNRDEWMVVASRDGSQVPVARSLKNHAGNRRDEKTGKLVLCYTEIAA